MAELPWCFSEHGRYLDQLSPTLAVRTQTVDDLGQVDSPRQVIVRPEGPDSHDVVIATTWLHLLDRIKDVVTPWHKQRL